MNILANAIDALDTSIEGLSFAQAQANHQQILIHTEIEGPTHGNNLHQR